MCVDLFDDIINLEAETLDLFVPAWQCLASCNKGNRFFGVHST